MNKMIWTFVAAAIACLFVFPVVYTFINSLKSEGEIYVDYTPLYAEDRQAANPRMHEEYAELRWIPDKVSLSQYASLLLLKPTYLLMFWNSVGLTVPIVVGQLITASLAAYALAILRFRYRNGLFFMYLITMVMPHQVTLVPNFIVADKLGLLNTYGAIIGPGIGALAVLVFIDNWNMIEQPLVFLRDDFKRPLSVYLSVIQEGERGIAFAASLIYMLPMVFLALYAEKYLVEGIQMSGIKG